MNPPGPKKRATPSRVSRPSTAVREADPPVPQHPRVTLIVGTDTGVGKTWVTAALAQALAALGQQVVAVKPIETGCSEPPSPEEGGARLAAATGQQGPQRALVRLPGLVAPAIAADQAGTPIDYDDLMARIRSLITPDSLLLVEGA